ncbi:MAG: cyclic-phosphate processing receiver domain-containing protein [Bacteroidota bacterium]
MPFEYINNNSTYKLFLDDIRTVDMVYKNWTDSDFLIVRNFDDFKSAIEDKGLPTYISFDNDLGLAENGEVAHDGYACAKWLV